MEQDTGVDLHFPSENKGADAVQPASGGSPPDCRIGVGSTPSSAGAKQKHHPLGGVSVWSRIRESNPPSRLGKPLYYRYTNPASSIDWGNYSRPQSKIQPQFVDGIKIVSGWRAVDIFLRFVFTPI